MLDHLKGLADSTAHPVVRLALAVAALAAAVKWLVSRVAWAVGLRARFVGLEATSAEARDALARVEARLDVAEAAQVRLSSEAAAQAREIGSLREQFAGLVGAMVRLGCHARCGLDSATLASERKA